MPCYYCDSVFQDGDIAVPLPLETMRRQENGGVLAEEREIVYVHQECLGNPNG